MGGLATSCDTIRNTGDLVIFVWSKESLVSFSSLDAFILQQHSHEIYRLRADPVGDCGITILSRYESKSKIFQIELSFILTTSPTNGRLIVATQGSFGEPPLKLFFYQAHSARYYSPSKRSVSPADSLEVINLSNSISSLSKIQVAIFVTTASPSVSLFIYILSLLNARREVA